MEMNEENFYREAFQRNIGILTQEQQKKLRNARVAVAGLGGVGGNYVLSLTRMGVGNFSVADPDFFETANINRQAGARVSVLGKSKSAVMREMALDINPFLNIAEFSSGISGENIDEFLQGADVVIDGLDFFAIKERIMLFKKAREAGKYAITSAPIGFGASLLVFDPQGMAFEEYFDIREHMEEKEMLLNFALGLSPSLVHRKYFQPKEIDFSKQSAPSSIIGVTTCAVLVAGEVLKIILSQKVNPAPFVSQFDPYLQKYKKKQLYGGNKNIFQRIKKMYFLKYLQHKGKL